MLDIFISNRSTQHTNAYLHMFLFFGNTNSNGINHIQMEKKSKSSPFCNSHLFQGEQ